MDSRCAHEWLSARRLPPLEIYYVDEGSGLQDGTKPWFETILETISGENVLSMESNWYFCNAIMIKNVAEVDRADPYSRKER